MTSALLPTVFFADVRRRRGQPLVGRFGTHPSGLHTIAARFAAGSVIPGLMSRIWRTWAAWEWPASLLAGLRRPDRCYHGAPGADVQLMAGDVTFVQHRRRNADRRWNAGPMPAGHVPVRPGWRHRGPGLVGPRLGVAGPAGPVPSPCGDRLLPAVRIPTRLRPDFWSKTPTRSLTCGDGCPMRVGVGRVGRGEVADPTFSTNIQAVRTPCMLSRWSGRPAARRRRRRAVLPWRWSGGTRCGSGCTWPSRRCCVVSTFRLFSNLSRCSPAICHALVAARFSTLRPYSSSG